MEDIDLMLRELLILEASVKASSKRISEIKEWCKSQGSFSTNMFVCSVKEHTRTGLVGLEKALQALGRETLEKHELINTSQFQTVHVSSRADTRDLERIG